MAPLLTLLRHRCSASSKTTRPFLLASHHRFSTAPCPFPQPDSAPPPPPSPDPPRTGLSARMSFVFDQMDAIDRMRGAKDDALQQIRAWRQNKQQQRQQPESSSGEAAVVEPTPEEEERKTMGESKLEETTNVLKREVELAHPWPEWIELMERLAQHNYFDHRRFDEDCMVRDLPIDLSGITDDVGFDFTRDWTTVRTACLNFGRDRFDILRSLSRKDLQILVGNGCPTVDPKVVFSAKLLRKHTHLDEGDVCSSCSLRHSCGKGYLLTRKEDEARTLDVMRILLTFGFDSIIGSVENKDLMKMKSVKIVVRKLLHEVVKLSSVPIDPNLPPPVIKKPPPKVKQPPPPPKKRVGRDDVEMKKGDWLCPKCDFMNFAKNVVCLQCDAKRPKRQLLPGEWECPECNFLNYRRNMACFHCEHKRPPDEFMESQMELKHQSPRTRLERAARSVSNAWNFDFDDNESDGADVAAFEFADPPRMSENSSLDGPLRGVQNRAFEDDAPGTGKMTRINDRAKYFSEPNERKYSPRSGFDDFEDEEDNVDSYEIDDQPKNPIREVSPKNISEFEDSAESEDFDDFGHDSRPSRVLDASLSGSEDEDALNVDSDSDILDQPHWKSNHTADSRKSTQAKGRNNLDRRMSSGSKGLERYSDFDDDVDMGFPSKQRGNQQTYGGRSPGRGRSFHPEDGLGSESDGDDGFHSSRNRMGGSKGSINGRRKSFRGRDQSFSSRSAEFRTDDRRTKRTSSGNTNDDWSFRGSRNNSRGTHYNGYGAQRGRDKRGDLQDFGRPPRREGFKHGQGGRSNQFNDSSISVNDDRPRRRIIER